MTSGKSSREGLLLYPPGACPANPYSSLPTLAAFLRAHGIDVELRDLNVDAYDSWIGEDSEYLYRGGDESARACSWDASVKMAKAFMRGQIGDFFAPHSYETHCTVLKAALQEVSDRYRNVSITWGGYRRELDSLDVDGLRSLLRPGRDPVVDFLDQALHDEDLDRFAWIGISLTFDPQLVPALLTALWIRAHGYRGKLVVGGACAQFIVDVFETHPELFRVIDALIVMEGESALLTLAREPEIEVARLPNVVTQGPDGSILRGPVRVENVKSLPAPDYAGLPLHLYFAPAPVLITSTSRGCYYNRCTFCVPSFGRAEGFRCRTPQQVADDLKSLSQTTGSPYVFFADDCITPTYLCKVWDSYDGNTPLMWQTEMRFEPSLTRPVLEKLKRHGCAQLIFGFESANQRVLDKMDKGTQRPVIDRVLRDCAQVGINVNLQTMIGFPTETVAEALETFDYLREKRRVASFSMGHFRLLGKTPISQQPAAFGLSDIKHEGYGSLFSYCAETGLSSAHAEVLTDTFYAQLLDDYPVNTFFLDGPMGAHALHYAGRGPLLRQSLLEPMPESAYSRQR